MHTVLSSVSRAARVITIFSGLTSIVACELIPPTASETVEPSVEVVGRLPQALASGALTAINGTYVGCLSRSGAWSIRISGVAALANTALSVVKDDTSCRLSVTELVTSVTYAATPTITLATSYAGSASAFAVSGGQTAFYANAKIDSLAFAGDFQISIQYSDDVSTADASSLTASYTTVQGSVQAGVVTAPDYTLSLSTGTPLTMQMNALSIVQALAGNATLVDGSIAGTSYAIDLGTLGANPSYLDVSTAYGLAIPHSITGTSPSIPGAQFGLVGLSILTPLVRTIIVARTVTGVTSYELFKVTFKAS